MCVYVVAFVRLSSGLGLGVLFPSNSKENRKCWVAFSQRTIEKKISLSKGYPLKLVGVTS